MTSIPLDVLLLTMALLALAERFWKFACVVRFFRHAGGGETRRRGDKETRNGERTGTHFLLPSSVVHSSLTASLLQPILSGDPTLQACLEHNLRLQSAFELEYLWLLDANAGEAQRICTKLKTDFPERVIRIILLPPVGDGCSPKMVKLIAGSRLPVLRHQWDLPEFSFRASRCRAFCHVRHVSQRADREQRDKHT